MHSSASADIVKVIFSRAYSGPTPVCGLFDQIATKISPMPTRSAPKAPRRGSTA